MDKKNIFIAVVLLAVVVLIATNFQRFTGQAVGVQEMTTIRVENKYMESGEYVYATITPGKKCADKDIRVQSVNSALSDREFARFSEEGLSRYCDIITAHYKTGAGWAPGEYEIEVKDIATGEWIKDSFFIAG